MTKKQFVKAAANAGFDARYSGKERMFYLKALSENADHR